MVIILDRLGPVKSVALLGFYVSVSKTGAMQFLV